VLWLKHQSAIEAASFDTPGLSGKKIKKSFKIPSKVLGSS